MSDRRVDPTKPFFLVANSSWDNGDIDLNAESPNTFIDASEAKQHAREVVAGHGGESYVFECRPIIKAARGPVRLTEMKTASLRARAKE